MDPIEVNFHHAYRLLLAQEGGYSNVEADHGGATNYGISLRFLESLPGLEGDVDESGHVDADDIRALDEDTAAEFYYRHFWTHYQLGRVYQAQSACKIFGMVVNMRSQVAIKAVQRALRACGFTVTEDGVMGSKTVAAINSASWRAFVSALKSEQAGVYRTIVENDPSQAVFLQGWLSRAYDSGV